MSVVGISLSYVVSSLHEHTFSTSLITCDANVRYPYFLPTLMSRCLLYGICGHLNYQTPNICGGIMKHDIFLFRMC